MGYPHTEAAENTASTPKFEQCEIGFKAHAPQCSLDNLYNTSNL